MAWSVVDDQPGLHGRRRLHRDGGLDQALLDEVELVRGDAVDAVEDDRVRGHRLEVDAARALEELVLGQAVAAAGGSRCARTPLAHDIVHGRPLSWNTPS
eukprot:16429407-Heterocapsa_arctica.AAC.1